jgi:saccharopine dehydrogenase (NAD+, L-lysine-forming)
VWERDRGWYTTPPFSEPEVFDFPGGIGGLADDGADLRRLWVRGTGLDGARRETYLFHVVDNAWSMREYGSQAVVWQTAVNPVVALELIDAGVWPGAGVLGPEALDAVRFLELLTDYGSPWALR